MNTDIELPEDVGLPPLNKMVKGYMVFITGDYPYLGDKKRWVTIGSSYGWSYDIKGFAINKAQKWAKHRLGGGKEKPSSCVVELKSGNMVWASWHNNNE